MRSGVDDLVVVEPRPEEGWSAATRRTAAAHPGRALLVGPGTVGDPAVAELLADPALGIGVVVPAVVDPGGLLVEAGALGVAGSLRPLGAGAPASDSRHRYRRDVDGTGQHRVAVSAAVVAAASLDPAGADAGEAVTRLLVAARALGQRVVYEPRWRIEVPEPVGDRRTVTPRPRASEILVVTGAVPADPFRTEDRAVRALLEELVAGAARSRLTLLTVDGFAAEPTAQDLRDLGIEVVTGPVDAAGWFTERALSFTTVIVTWSGLSGELGAWIRATQAQATTALYLPTLPTRDLDTIGPIVPPREHAGLDELRRATTDRLRHAATWVDAVWCDNEGDATALRVSGFPEVSALGPALQPPEPEPPVTPARDGIVVVAEDGADVIAGNEDAARHVLTGVLPRLRHRWPDLACTVVAGRPSPELETACRLAGVSLAPPDHAVDTIRAAELLLVGHQHGTGGRPAILTALATGTPFLATPWAAAYVELGDLAGHTVTDGEELLTVARHLLGDDAAREALARRVRSTAARMTAPDARRRRLGTALAALGVTPARPWRSPWPTRPPTVVPTPAAAPVALRPPGWTPEPPGPPVEPDDVHHRYREWARRLGPNAATLDALAADLETAPYQPLISVLVPVYNTDPTLLIKAVESVRRQLYPHWELCLADDGSDRSETLATLDELADDPAITVVHLPGNGGISAATNAALEVAQGDYVALLDHDDELKPHALAQVVRWLNADPELDLVFSDEDKLDTEGRLVWPHLKPGWAPDLFHTNNYVCHLTVVRRSMAVDIGGLRPDCDGAQDYDLVVRVSERSDRIAHIPEPLYSWRQIPSSTASGEAAKPWAFLVGRRVLEDHLTRTGTEGRVDNTPWAGRFRIRYGIPGTPKVSIVIPTRDRLDLLRPCVTSILERSTWTNFELVVVDNQSAEGPTLGYLASLPARVIHYPHPFNYARMMNLAARTLETDLLLFVNNDTEVLSPDWMEALVEHAVRPEVGAVGGRLEFGDGRIQHEGVYVGIQGAANSVAHGDHEMYGDMVRNASAVTGACTMIRPSVFHRVGGNDERLRIAYNDVDLGLRLRQAGLSVVYTPHARLIHREGSSRQATDLPEHAGDAEVFVRRWEPATRGDAFYNPAYDPDALWRIDLGPHSSERLLRPRVRRAGALP